jgi:hypothetical protein
MCPGKDLLYGEGHTDDGQPAALVMALAEWAMVDHERINANRSHGRPTRPLLEMAART